MITKEFNPGIKMPNYLIRKRLLASIKEYSLLLNGKLLDFGCGSKPYRSLFKCEEYIGLDFESLGHPHNNEEIDIYYDGKTIPFSNNTFDAVFSSEVFEHIFNLENILKEINRVLKPGGKLLITCPFCFPEHEIPNDFARYTSFAIQDLLKRNNFDIQVYEKTGNTVEAIFQLWIIYLHLHLLSKLKNIPVIREIARIVVIIPLNILALASSKIFPVRKDLYLNNIVLASKRKEI